MRAPRRERGHNPDDGTGELIPDTTMITLDCFSVRVWETVGVSVHPRLAVGTGMP